MGQKNQMTCVVFAMQVHTAIDVLGGSLCRFYQCKFKPRKRFTLVLLRSSSLKVAPSATLKLYIMMHLNTAVYKPVQKFSKQNFLRRSLYILQSVISDFWVFREKLYTRWLQRTCSPVVPAHLRCKMRGKHGVCETSRERESCLTPGSPLVVLYNPRPQSMASIKRGIKCRVTPASASVPAGRFSAGAGPRRRQVRRNAPPHGLRLQSRSLPGGASLASRTQSFRANVCDFISP